MSSHLALSPGNLNGSEVLTALPFEGMDATIGFSVGSLVRVLATSPAPVDLKRPGRTSNFVFLEFFCPANGGRYGRFRLGFWVHGFEKLDAAPGLNIQRLNPRYRRRLIVL
jgi:hypothetical protein